MYVCVRGTNTRSRASGLSPSPLLSVYPQCYSEGAMTLFTHNVECTTLKVVCLHRYMYACMCKVCVSKIECKRSFTNITGIHNNITPGCMFRLGATHMV